jgi:hypothetical protein
MRLFGGFLDTARMRVLRMFPQVQTLLADLIKQRALIPPRAQLLGMDLLSVGLKNTLVKAEGRGCPWHAWTVGGETFAITGTLEDTSSRMHARPVLRVLLYDIQGRVIGSSQWLETQPGQWRDL